jgi:hypothetical protein
MIATTEAMDVPAAAMNPVLLTHVPELFEPRGDENWVKDLHGVRVDDLRELNGLHIRRRRVKKRLCGDLPSIFTKCARVGEFSRKKETILAIHSCTNFALLDTHCVPERSAEEHPSQFWMRPYDAVVRGRPAVVPRKKKKGRVSQTTRPWSNP